METPEERKRRLARERQQRRRQRLKGEKTLLLARCPICTSYFLLKENQGSPKRFCRRQCIDRNAYLHSKYTGEGNDTVAGRTVGLSLLYAVGGRLPDEAAHRLFGSLAPRYRGEEGQKAWTKEQTDWILCSDLSPEEYKERVQVLWEQEQGIYR